MRVHANLDGGSLANVSDTEDELSSAMALMISGRSIEEISRILQLTHFKCIAVKRGQSVVVYAYCGTEEELEQLHEMWVSGSLRETVELMFNQLLIRSQIIAVTNVTISNEELENGEKYLKGKESFPLLLGTIC